MRPFKHDWDEAKRCYESGLSQVEIVKRLQVPKSSLSERIKKGNWVLNELASSVVKGKVKVSEQMNELSDVNEPLARTAIKIAEEKAQNVDLIHNSARFFLKKAVKQAQDEDATMQDFALGAKIVTETGMNLGVIARHAPKQDVNVNQQNNQMNKIEIVLDD
ncbi:MAG: hypothetical protein JJV88_04790 [Sulfurovum sp.]|nr:hypothetical protein [Sulfurovaceae bacterium]